MPMKIISGIKLLTKTIILQNLLFSKNTNFKQHFAQFLSNQEKTNSNFKNARIRVKIFLFF